MRAVVMTAIGLDNLKVVEMPSPRPGRGEALVRVKYVGLNPIDYFVVSGSVKPPSIPHLPGAEFVGVVEDVGPDVGGLSPGDKVVVYNRVFCGHCRYCLEGETQLCASGGIIGVSYPGGMAQFAAVPAKNLVKTKAELLDVVGLPIGGLTAYNMLKRAGVKAGEAVAVVGSTGNVGLFAVQLAKALGAYVVAVTRKKSAAEPLLKSLGADAVATPSEAPELLKGLGGADVVADAVGSATWELSLSLLGRGGRYVTAGALTGSEAKLDLRRLYGAQLSVVGSTGGRRRDLDVLTAMAERGLVKTPIYKVFKLEGVREAFEAMLAPDRLGKVALEV